ncbi:hypothetical protein HMPREF9228_0045 [Bifidobacterium breve ACS-071-V-Sch8b]|nr:hypothetical protein HMPREF9228_0045 [Bifidobacterium breve ACS-071-V-Sch8b]
MGVEFSYGRCAFRLRRIFFFCSLTLSITTPRLPLRQSPDA